MTRTKNCKNFFFQSRALSTLKTKPNLSTRQAVRQGLGVQGRPNQATVLTKNIASNHQLLRPTALRLSRRCLVCPPPNPPKSAASKLKQFLIIGMNRTPSESIEKSIGGEIHRKPLYFKLVEIPEETSPPHDIFGKAVERKMRLDLEKTKELMRKEGLVFDNSAAKGWLGELAVCVWESFFGNPHSTITINGKSYKPQEATQKVWNPKAAGKGESSDVLIKEEKYSVSFDQEESTLYTHKSSVEVKNRPSDFENSSQVAGENRSLGAAEKAKHVKGKEASSEEVDTSFGPTLVERTKQNVAILSPHSDVTSRTTSRESSVFFDQTNYTMDKESVAAMEKAAQILSTSSDYDQ